MYERVEPLYEHVPLAILHERVQDSVPELVDVVFDTDVHGVVHVHELLELVPLTAVYPELHDVEYDVTLHVLLYDEQPEQDAPADEQPELV